MNNLQKLTDLLCEVKEIKEDISQKAYVVSITSNEDNRYNNQMFSYIFWKCNSKDEAIWKAIWETRKQKENANNKILIELAFEYEKDIEYHHLMMYCTKNIIPINISAYWEVSIIQNFICKFNNTLPLHKQSEEVLWALVEYISNLK